MSNFISPLNLSMVSSAIKILIESPTLSFSFPSDFLPFKTMFFFLSILYIKPDVASLKYLNKNLSKRCPA